jgi:7,8-didemethyl-8-hydroxy-5-deazariboflavin synthase CofH subunit
MTTTPANTAQLTSLLDRFMSTIDPSIARILNSALEDREISVEACIKLLEVRDFELTALTLVADELRRRAVGDIITYVVNRNINFTNICYVGCKFCGFKRRPDQPDAYMRSEEELEAKVEDAVNRGATEVCIQGGLPRNMDGYKYRDILCLVKKKAPQIHIHAYSPMEIVHGVERTGLTLEDYLVMLREAGLGTIPGTAAEILDDDVRRVLSQNRLKVSMWVKIITTAHKLGIPSTATIMYGHVEKPFHVANHLALIRSIQKETGGFTEFVPLGFIHENTFLYRKDGSRPGPTGLEEIRMHAVSRIMLHGYIKNIQVSWVKLGLKLSQLCLNAGANDFSGTLMEENISKAAGATNGEYLAPEEMRRLIWDLGRTPAERSTTYKLLKVYDKKEDVITEANPEYTEEMVVPPYATMSLT